MQFVDGVNRLLRIEHIITGDDDDITTFSDSQHAADISLAQIAIQDEITSLTAERLIDYEHTTGTITLLTDTRVYSLANGFIRFFGKASFYDSTQNVRIYEYDGGEQSLMNYDYQYKTVSGSPTWWYWNSTTSKQVAFYQVPNSSYNNRSLSYDYEASVMVTNTSDTLPLHNNEEAFAFIGCAARRFHYMITKKEIGLLGSDPTYVDAKSRLYDLMKPTNAPRFYGNTY